MDQQDEGWELQPCPCGSAAVAAAFHAPDRLFGAPGLFQVVTCAGCRLQRTAPRPDPDHIMSYYPDEYGPHHHDDEAPTHARSTARWRRWTHRVLGSGATQLPRVRRGAKAVELGSGGGAFLERLAGAGIDASGVEPNAAAAARARARSSLAVAERSITDVSFDEESLDLVVAWMVIEHLHDPKATLRRINHWLKPGALLAFSVPDIDSMPARLFKTYWYDLSLPIHLFHFTRRTVREMLVDAGFDVTMVRDQGTVDDWRKSLVLVLEARRGSWARYVGSMLESRPVRLGFRALGPVGRLPGVSGRLTIWATKRPDG